MLSRNSGVEIGDRTTWWGVRPSPACLCKLVVPSEIEGMVRQIKWSGRLFRDPRLNLADSLARTCRSLWEKPGFRFVEGEGRGFIFFGLPEGDTTRVNLVGVLPEYQNQGVAVSLLALSPTPYIIAGTYEDNVAAMALYKSVGMQIVRHEKIFNK